MSDSKWKADKSLLEQFKSTGRVLLMNDMEDSHCGNIAMLWTDKDGNENIVITATGSQKGDLDEHQICFLSTTETDFGYYKASSETDIHARILEMKGVTATIHAHTKDLTIMTQDDEAKPNQPPSFIPIDQLGFYHLGGEIPVDWVAVPCGSPDMTRIIPERLKHHFATLIQGHGTFARGRDLKEALYRICLANNSGIIARLAARFGIDTKKLGSDIKSDPNSFFAYPPPAYDVMDRSSLTFSGEEEIKAEFKKTGARLFESHLSPFHTGTISVRGVKTMLYAPKASMPRDIGGPLWELPLAAQKTDHRELELHKKIYAASQFQTIIHSYIPEAEVMSRCILPGKDKPEDRIVPIDAEGSFLYLVIPILPPDFAAEDLVRMLHDYKVVIVRGGGVWGVGSQSLSEVLHHPSSVREICWYRFGAIERGLNIGDLEPDQAKNW